MTTTKSSELFISTGCDGDCCADATSPLEALTIDLAAALKLSARTMELTPTHHTVRSAFLQACIDLDLNQDDAAVQLLPTAWADVVSEDVIVMPTNVLGVDLTSVPALGIDATALVVASDNLRHQLTRTLEQLR